MMLLMMMKTTEKTKTDKTAGNDESPPPPRDLEPPCLLLWNSGYRKKYTITLLDLEKSKIMILKSTGSPRGGTVEGHTRRPYGDSGTREPGEEIQARDTSQVRRQPQSARETANPPNLAAPLLPDTVPASQSKETDGLPAWVIA